MNIQALTGSKPALDDDCLNPREDLHADFQDQIEWRQKKAKQYPDDPGNVKAVEIFERLVATLPEVADVLVLEYDQINDDLPDDKLHDAFMRSVGFRYCPEPITAERFIRDFIAKYKSEN